METDWSFHPTKRCKHGQAQLRQQQAVEEVGRGGQSAQARWVGQRGLAALEEADSFVLHQRGLLRRVLPDLPEP